MKTISMSGSLRENVGKKDAKALRKQGKVPCVLYGGESQIHFAMAAADFKGLIFTPDIAFVELNIDGNVQKAILQDVQYHTVTGNIMHADFLTLSDDKEIIMGVPIKTTGNSVGVIEGGIFMVKLHRVKIKSLPADMPESITIDITDLKIGDSIKVGQIDSHNLTLLDSPNAVVVTVRVTRAAVSAAEEGEEGEGIEGVEGESETAPAE